MIFSLVVIGIIFLYGLACLFFGTMLKRNHAVEQNYEPLVSIVVAARNEAENLPACFESLVSVDYPRERLEIIIVDDLSSDATGELLDSYQQKNPHVKVFHITHTKKKPGKAGALLEGIKKTCGEIIFVTDADCRVPKTWIKSVLKMFDENTGLSGGFTFIDSGVNQKITWWHASQALELFFLQTVAFVYAKLNHPVSWLGNNLAFRRTAYDEVGGFQNLDETLVEDYALINAVRQRTNWKARFCLDPLGVIKSQPVANLKSLYIQRKRWASDRKNIPIEALVTMILNYVARSFLLFALMVMPIWLAIFCVLFVFLFDFLLLTRIAKIFGAQNLIKAIGGFEFVTILTTLIFPIMFLFDKKVSWKE